MVIMIIIDKIDYSEKDNDASNTSRITIKNTQPNILKMLHYWPILGEYIYKKSKSLSVK